jgi:plastocyanin
MRFTLSKTITAGIAASLALASTAAFAVDHPVTANPNLTFTPANLTINAGDTVTFTNTGGLHNVTSDPGAVTSFHCSTACGASPTGNPSSALWSQTITFPTPGSVGFFCEQHGGPGGVGMSGVITVSPTPVELQSFDVD